MLESSGPATSVPSSADPTPPTTESLVASAPAATSPSFVLSAQDLTQAFTRALGDSLPHFWWPCKATPQIHVLRCHITRRQEVSVLYVHLPFLRWSLLLWTGLPWLAQAILSFLRSWLPKSGQGNLFIWPTYYPKTWRFRRRSHKHISMENFWWVHPRKGYKNSLTLSHGWRHSHSTCGSFAAHILLDGRTWHSASSWFWRTHVSSLARCGFTMILPFRRMPLHQAWQTGRHSPSHQPLHLHPLTQAACPPTFAHRGMMAPVAGLLVSAGTVTAVRNAKGTPIVLTAPFGPPNHPSISTHGQLTLYDTNAKGVEAVARSPKGLQPKG